MRKTTELIEVRLADWFSVIEYSLQAEQNLVLEGEKWTNSRDNNCILANGWSLSFELVFGMAQV